VPSGIFADRYGYKTSLIIGSLFLLFLQKTSSLFFVFPVLAVFYFLRGLYAPTVSTYINNKVDSSKRATMLSVNSQFLTIITSISLMFTGYIAHTYDLSLVFFTLSIGSIVFLIAYVLSLRSIEAD
jgi:sugar phosphate permease